MHGDGGGRTYGWPGFITAPTTAAFVYDNAHSFGRGSSNAKGDLHSASGGNPMIEKNAEIWPWREGANGQRT